MTGPSLVPQQFPYVYNLCLALERSLGEHAPGRGDTTVGLTLAGYRSLECKRLEEPVTEKPLFREQAVDFQRQRLFGEVRLDRTLSSWVLTGFVGTIIISALLVLIFGTHTRRETVQGWLTPDKGMVRIYAPEGGIIESVAVAEGNVVQAGDTLFVVSRDRGLLGGGAATAQILKQIRNERAEVRRQLELIAIQFEATVKRLADRREGLSRERDQLSRQIELQQDRIAIVKGQLDRTAMLVSKGTISKTQQEQQRESLLSLMQSRESLTGQLAAADRELAELEREIAELPTSRAAEAAQLRARLAALDQRITEARSQGTVVVRAPVAGRLAVITARAGQATRSNVMRAAILPEGGQLEAELFVPSRAAGFIRVGQTVRLRYDAFPSQKFGFANATVTAVSKTILNPRDVTDLFDMPEPVFRVIAQLEADHVEAYGETFPLQAGMKLSADIILEKRKMWEIVFDPILSAAR